MSWPLCKYFIKKGITCYKYSGYGPGKIVGTDKRFHRCLFGDCGVYVFEK